MTGQSEGNTGTSSFDQKDSNGKIRSKTSPSSRDSKNCFDGSKIYVFDGGFATHLTSVLNDDALMNDPLWSCGALQRHPQAVTQTHRDYIEAGADIIGTNTYQAHFQLFRKHLRFKDPALDPHLLIESSVGLAREGVRLAATTTAGHGALVAGSVGPYGACLGDGSEYNGKYIGSEGLSEDEWRSKLREWHRDRIKRLTVAGVDFFAVETIPSVIEALAVLDVLEDIPGSRCWISFQCKEGGATTARGEPIEEAFTTLAAHPGFRFKVLAIGANCVSPRDVESILTRLNTVNHWSKFPGVLNYKKVPYVVYPNAGRSYDPVAKCFTDEKCLQVVLDQIRKWIGLGANVIGGCCEVGPDDIRRIADKVTLELFDALEDRAKMEDETRNTRDDWAEIEARLKKPSYDELKKKKSGSDGGTAAGGHHFVKDLEGDGGIGAFSKLHHEMEQAILQGEDKL